MSTSTRTTPTLPQIHIQVVLSISLIFSTLFTQNTDNSSSPSTDRNDTEDMEAHWLLPRHLFLPPNCIVMPQVARIGTWKLGTWKIFHGLDRHFCRLQLVGSRHPDALSEDRNQNIVVFSGISQPKWPSREPQTKSQFSQETALGNSSRKCTLNHSKNSQIPSGKSLPDFSG